MARQDRGLRLLDKIEERNIEGVKDILQYDVDLTVDRKGDTPIHLAARKGYLDVIKLLVEKGCDVNLKNQNGFAALHYAAREGRMDMVHFLIKHGAKPNIKNADGDAPIHELVKYQPMDVIEEMVNLGMDINLENQMGRTPLHVAAAFNRQEAMETLLLCGAKSNIKDSTGRTPGESCRNSHLADVITLHTLTLSAMKKGTIKAQGIAVTKQRAKNRIQLERVGVTIETMILATDGTASLYIRREKSENSSNTFRTDVGDEIISDVFFIKMTNAPKSADVTLTVPFYDMPTETEEMFVRFDHGGKLLITSSQTTEQGHFCTFPTKLIPDDFCVCALFTRALTDVKKVGQEGGVVTTQADTEMKLEIPPDTFDKETNISIQVYQRVDDNTEETSDAIFTDVYSLTADTPIHSTNMTLTLPLRHEVDDIQDVTLVTADEITDDTDERCLKVVDAEPRVVNNAHVPVSKRQYDTNKKGIYDILVKSTERQRSAVFFLVAQYDEESGPIIVVECSLAEKCPKRLENWTSYGYDIQSPEQSGMIMLRPCQDFAVSFQGAVPADPTVHRKLSFVPRRASFQPFRLSMQSKDGCYIAGTVTIQKTSEQKNPLRSETIAVLPFSIKVEEEVQTLEPKQKEWLTPPHWKY